MISCIFYTLKSYFPTTVFPAGLVGMYFLTVYMIFHKANTVRCTSVHTIFHVLTHFLRCAFSHSCNSSTINSQRGTLYVCATKIPVATPKTNDQKRIYIIYSYIYSHYYCPPLGRPCGFLTGLIGVFFFFSVSFRRFSRALAAACFFWARVND